MWGSGRDPERLASLTWPSALCAPEGDGPRLEHGQDSGRETAGRLTGAWGEDRNGKIRNKEV